MELLDRGELHLVRAQTPPPRARQRAAAARTERHTLSAAQGNPQK
jgi:hypothetical protein